MTTPHLTQALVVGGGICGIGTAIRLRDEAGLDDVVILEKSDQLGGTWSDNTYPGCACDIPSALYSYEFAPNPGWTRVFAEQGEIQSYVKRVAEEHGVPGLTVFGAEVLSATWDDEAQLWRAETTQGDFAAPILVFAPGPLHEPKLPPVPGIESFAGHQFHSARWDHDHLLDDKRVAVIGTGPSAIQFVPRIRERTQHLTLLQRSPGWVLPKPDWKTSRLERAFYRAFPPAFRALRRAQWWFSDFLILLYGRERLARCLNLIARAHLALTVRDRSMRKELTPDYTLGCKRVLLSNNYYPAITKPDVTLVPHSVREVREHSVVAEDGSEHEVDTIIWATGFHVSDLPFTERLRGRCGQTLAETWNGNPSAYMGMTIAGFPNAFMLFGPNIGTASAFAMLEGQLNHLVAAVRAMREHDLATVEVRPEVVATHKATMNRRLAKSTWNAGGCTSYYMDSTGENYSVFPGTMRELVRSASRFDLSDYHAAAAREPRENRVTA